jgi:hypothetical protein
MFLLFGSLLHTLTATIDLVRSEILTTVVMKTSPCYLFDSDFLSGFFFDPEHGSDMFLTLAFNELHIVMSQKIQLFKLECVQRKFSMLCYNKHFKNHNSYSYSYARNRDSSVGIATGYWLDDRGVGVRVMVGSGIFAYPYRPEWLLGPPKLLFNGYRGLCPRG